MKNSIYKMFLLLIASLYSNACSVISNKYDSLKMECGIASVPADQYLMKVLSEDGSQLSPSEKATLQGRILLKTGESKNAVFSESGCLIVEKNALLLQLNSRSGTKISQISLPLTEPKKRPEYSTVQLEPAKTPELSLNCPTGGIFANSSIDFPIISTSDAGLSAIEVEIIAKNKRSSIEKRLFRKEYGSKAWGQGKSLSLRELEDGEYDLLLRAKDSVQGFDEPLNLSQQGAQCPLWVIHRNPELKGELGLASSPKQRFQSGEPILWFSEGSASQLNVCREFVTEDEDKGVSSLCEAKSLCRDDANFQPSMGLVASDKGVYNYFYFASDKAENRSAKYCKHVVISAQKPEISISWQNSEWNKPHSVSDRAYRTLSTHISVTHPQLSDEDVRSRLECKVDFLMDGEAVLPGFDARCLKGRCAGKTLEKFQPCDDGFEFSLANYWKKYSSRASQLNVTVRVADTEGFQNEVNRKLWLHPSRWTPEESLVTSEKTSHAGVFPAFFEGSDSKILFQSYDGFFAFDDESRSWSEIDLPEDAEAVKIVQNHMKEIFAITKSQTVENTYRIFRREGDSWMLSAESPLLKECMNKTVSFGDSGILCDSNKPIFFDKSEVAEISLPKNADGLACDLGGDSKIAVSGDRTLWTVCFNTLYSKSLKGEWVLEKKFEAEGINSLQIDRLGRVWVPRNGYYFEKAWHPVKFPTERTSRWSIHGDEMTFLDNGDVFFLDFKWDEKNEAWGYVFDKEKIQNVDNLFAITNGKHVLFRSQHDLVLLDSGILSNNFITWETRMDSPRLTFLDSRGRIFGMDWGAGGTDTYKLYVIERSRFTVFGPEISMGKVYDPYDPNVVNYSFAGEGSVVAYTPNEGIFRFQSNGEFGHETLDKSFDSTARFELISCDLSGRYVKEGLVQPSLEVVAFVKDKQPLFYRLSDESYMVFLELENNALLVENGKITKTVVPFNAWGFASRFDYTCAIQVKDKIIVWGANDKEPTYSFSRSTGSWDRIEPSGFGLPLRLGIRWVEDRSRKIQNFWLESVPGVIEIYDEDDGLVSSWKIPDGETIEHVIQADETRFVGWNSKGLVVSDGSQWWTVAYHPDFASGHATLDEWGRVWFGGQYGRLIQLETGLP